MLDSADDAERNRRSSIKLEVAGFMLFSEQMVASRGLDNIPNHSMLSNFLHKRSSGDRHCKSREVREVKQRGSRIVQPVEGFGEATLNKSVGIEQ